jgi:hypothetical protein
MPSVPFFTNAAAALLPPLAFLATDMMNDEVKWKPMQICK